MKLLTLPLGGAICSSVDLDNKIRVDGRVNDGWFKDWKDEVEFVKHATHFASDAYITPRCLLELLAYLDTVDFKTFDGVLIMTGRDTIGYLSSFISMCFCSAGVPIVLISSELPSTMWNSKAYHSFCSAIRFIQSKAEPSGVFVVEGNRVYEGHKVICPTVYGDTLRYIEDDCYGVIENTTFKRTPGHRASTPESIRPLPVPTTLNTVPMILCYPGLNVDSMPLNSKAVILIPQASGLMCIAGEYSLLNYIKECKKNDVEVYVLGTAPQYCDYEEKRLYKDVTFLGNITMETALAKVSLAQQLDDVVRKVYFT